MFEHVHWAFDERSLVMTDYGPGIQNRVRAGDLTLPTGELVLGEGPAEELPSVELGPGTYPVFFSLHRPEHVPGRRGRRLLFVRVALRDEVPEWWEPKGSWFTDAGAGVIYDRSLSAALGEVDGETRLATRARSLEDEPRSSLDLGAGNAILFETDDTYLHLALGRDRLDRPVCALVVLYRDASSG